MNITRIRKERLKSKIQNARAELLTEATFFGILSMYLKYVAVDNIKNISTNGKCIYFNPGFVDKLTPYETQFVICHQIMHIISGNIWRAVYKAGDEYHRAYDVSVNHQLIRLGWDAERFSHLGKLQHEIPLCRYPIEKMTPDEIFSAFPYKLSALDEKTRNRHMADSDLWWDHKDDSGEGGVVILDTPYMTAWSNPQRSAGGGNAGTGKGMQDFWESKTAMAAQLAKSRNGNKGAGSIPDSVKRAVDSKQKPTLDWRKILDDFIQEEISDYSFAPPDRRFSDSGFFLPDYNEKEFVSKDILFMADTSGSIDKKALESVYAELRGAMEQFKGKINGKLGFFDAEVTPPIPFDSVGSLNRIVPYGGGGTNFNSVFDHVRNQMQHCLPAAIVIFTDGYGPYPEEQTTMGIPVLWLIDNEDVDPPFGRVARVLRDSLK